MRRIALILVGAAVAAVVMTSANAAELPPFPRAGLVSQDAPLRGAPRDTASRYACVASGTVSEMSRTPSPWSR